MRFTTGLIGGKVLPFRVRLPFRESVIDTAVENPSSNRRAAALVLFAMNMTALAFVRSLSGHGCSLADLSLDPAMRRLLARVVSKVAGSASSGWSETMIDVAVTP